MKAVVSRREGCFCPLFPIPFSLQVSHLRSLSLLSSTTGWEEWERRWATVGQESRREERRSWQQTTTDGKRGKVAFVPKKEVPTVSIQETQVISELSLKYLMLFIIILWECCWSFSLSLFENGKRLSVYTTWLRERKREERMRVMEIKRDRKEGGSLFTSFTLFLLSSRITCDLVSLPHPPIILLSFPLPLLLFFLLRESAVSFPPSPSFFLNLPPVFSFFLVHHHHLPSISLLSTPSLTILHFPYCWMLVVFACPLSPSPFSCNRREWKEHSCFIILSIFFYIVWYYSFVSFPLSPLFDQHLHHHPSILSLLCECIVFFLFDKRKGRQKMEKEWKKPPPWHTDRQQEKNQNFSFVC